jgi:hypothetical protein
MRGDESIAWVRDHVAGAVETEEQVAFVHEVVGRRA